MALSQSGITSAVGMALESTWTTVPLTTSVVGIASTNPCRFAIVESGSGMDPEVTRETKDEIDGDVSIRRSILTAKDYKGKFTHWMDGENAYYPLLGMFGRDIQTTSTAPTSTVTGTYKHQFRAGLYAPSFSIEEGIGNKTYGRLSSGAVIEELTITFGPTATIEYSVTAARQMTNQYPNASGVLTQYDFTSTPSVLPNQMGGNGTITAGINPAPTYVDVLQGVFVFANIGVGTKQASILEINGSAANITFLEGSSVTFKRTVESDMIAGSGFEPGAFTGGKFSVTGKIKGLYVDNGIPLAMLSDSQVSLNFLIKGPSIPTTPDSYSIELHVPNMRLDKAPVPLDNKAIMIDADFLGLKDPTAGYDASVFLLNTFSNATLGGTSPGAGGLGGWAAS